MSDNKKSILNLTMTPDEYVKLRYKITMRNLSSLAILLMAPMVFAAPNNLQIYFVDVEGGGATLIVTPAGSVMTIPLEPNDADRE